MFKNHYKMANTINIGGGGSITDVVLVDAIEDELIDRGFVESTRNAGLPKVYKAFITQKSDDDPDVNLIGTPTYNGEISFEYEDVGRYIVTSALNEFTVRTTVRFGHNFSSSSFFNGCFAQALRSDASQILIATIDITAGFSDEIFENTEIEIISYP